MKETKQCPYCGEEIMTGAKKCKHCGEWLDKSENAPTPPAPPAPAPDDNDDEEDEVKDGFFKYYWGEVCRKHLFDFTGSLGRKDYWCAWLTLTIMQAVGYYVAVIAFSFDSSPGKLIIGIVGLVASIVLSVTQMALAARRLHDLDKSGWWLLVGLIPFAGPIWLLVLLCQPGDTPSARIKANIGDWITGGLLVLLVIMHFAFLGDMINESLDEYDRTEQNYLEEDDNVDAEDLENATYICAYGTYTYLVDLGSADNEDYRPAALYKCDQETGDAERYIFENIQWGDSGGPISICGVSDYVVRNGKIYFITSNCALSTFAGCDAFYYNMDTGLFGYIDFGRGAEFVNNKSRLKVTYANLVKEGSCMAENEYEYEDVYYDL